MSMQVLGVDQGELRFFMTGGVDSGKDVGASPATYININVWKMVCRASDELEPMQKLSTSLKKDGAAWQALFESEEPHTLELPHGFTDLAAFQRLLVLRIVRPDKLILAIADFVSLSLSERYIQPPLFNLAEIWKDCTDPWVPLVFILSAGADPMAEVMKFAGEVGPRPTDRNQFHGSGFVGGASRGTVWVCAICSACTCFELHVPLFIPLTLVLIRVPPFVLPPLAADICSLIRSTYTCFECACLRLLHLHVVSTCVFSLIPFVCLECPPPPCLKPGASALTGRGHTPPLNKATPIRTREMTERTRI